MKARTLADSKAKSDTTVVTFKPRVRKVFTEDGDYIFKIMSAKFNPRTEYLSLSGIPTKVNKAGEVIEFERITLFIPTEYRTEDETILIDELFTALDIEIGKEVEVSFFEGKTFEVYISIREIVDEDGNIINIFYNPESIRKPQ